MIQHLVFLRPLGKLRTAYQIRSKQARSQACRAAYAEVKAALTAEGIAFDGVKVEGLLFDIEAKIVRDQVLAGEPRIDGRDTRTVRPIEIRTGVLPRVHGSALFTRGETQALVVATLGTEQDSQRIDALTEDATGTPIENMHDEEGPPSVSEARLTAFGEALWAVYDMHQIWHSLGPRTGTVIKAAEPGRNDLCTCGSGKKYKKCCGA